MGRRELIASTPFLARYAPSSRPWFAAKFATTCARTAWASIRGGSRHAVDPRCGRACLIHCPIHYAIHYPIHWAIHHPSPYLIHYPVHYRGLQSKTGKREIPSGGPNMRPVASRLPPRMSTSTACRCSPLRVLSQTLAFDAEMFLTGGWQRLQVWSWERRGPGTVTTSEHASQAWSCGRSRADLANGSGNWACGRRGAILLRGRARHTEAFRAERGRGLV
jgi:hypothetical protein